MSRLLVDGYADIAARTKRRLHATFELSDLKHIKIVEMTNASVSAQIEILGDDVADGFPACANIPGRAPRTGDVGSPSPGERPAADVPAHVASGRRNRLGDLGVARALIKLQAVASAIDSMNMDGFLGCVAGDDTIIIVSRDVESSEQIGERIRELVKTV